MKWTRVTAIAAKQWLTLRHDRRSLALMLLAPVMAMLIFGFAFGDDLKHVPVRLVNQDAGPLAQSIIGHLDDETLSIQTDQDAAAARAAVSSGEASAAIIFPEHFTADASPTLNGRQPVAPVGTSIELFIDTTNQQLAAAVSQSLAQALRDYAAEQTTQPISIETDYAFAAAKDARYIDYFVPGVMAFAAMLFTTLLTLLAFVSERTSGTLARLRTTPVTPTEIVLGYELAFGVIAAIQGILLLLVATLVYHVMIVGSIWLAGLIVILTAIDAQAIGIVISAAAQREGQAVQFIPFIVLPTFLLSGIFIPISSLPAWLQPVSYLLPPSWAIEGLRNVFLRGWGWSDVWPTAAVLVGFAILFTLMAIVGLRRPIK